MISNPGVSASCQVLFINTVAVVVVVVVVASSRRRVVVVVVVVGGRDDPGVGHVMTQVGHSSATVMTEGGSRDVPGGSRRVRVVDLTVTEGGGARDFRAADIKPYKCVAQL